MAISELDHFFRPFKDEYEEIYNELNHKLFDGFWFFLDENFLKIFDIKEKEKGLSIAFSGCFLDRQKLISNYYLSREYISYKKDYSTLLSLKKMAKNIIIFDDEIYSIKFMINNKEFSDIIPYGFEQFKSLVLLNKVKCYLKVTRSSKRSYYESLTEFHLVLNQCKDDFLRLINNDHYWKTNPEHFSKNLSDFQIISYNTKKPKVVTPLDISHITFSQWSELFLVFGFYFCEKSKKYL